MNGFMEDPKLVWDWYKDRRDTFINATPNRAHYLLAELEKTKSVTIVTQNIDDLHEKAGSTNVLHLHGQGDKAKCTNDACGWHGNYSETYPGTMPKCPWCDELARPDVVWFGEMLDTKIVDAAINAFKNADVCLVIGTSSDVQPAASLPQWTSMMGRDIISINKRREDHNDYATVKLTGRASSVLGMIL
ncbi:hypothetical protein RsoM2USA_112 [Ralstonia phage RsoM2USA]|nr:hypothetical protein RsoM2USA_112 [Ralstonia phage RsoM2USA]